MKSCFISVSLYKDMLSFCEKGYPEEVAGLFVGLATPKRTLVKKIINTVNTRSKHMRATRFTIDPSDWLIASEFALANNFEVTGVFHSHPDHPPFPSQTDLDNAFPNLIYVIIEISKGVVADSRTWSLKDDRSGFEECNLVII